MDKLQAKITGHNSTEAQLARLAYRTGEAATALGCSRQTIYDMMNSGALRSIKFGGSRFIPAAALHEFLAGTDEVA